MARSLPPYLLLLTHIPSYLPSIPEIFLRSSYEMAAPGPGALVPAGGVVQRALSPATPNTN